MARKKVKVAWIANDATRRVTLKKRRKGVLKKVRELSILCDVRACAIIYSPDEPRPEVWPSVPETTRVLSHFLSMSEIEKSKKMMSQETFLQQRVAKLREQLLRLDRENRKLESDALLRECVAGASLAHLNFEELATLAWLVEQKAEAVQERIDHLCCPSASKPPLLCDANPLSVAGLPQYNLSKPALKQGSFYKENRQQLSGKGIGDAAANFIGVLGGGTVAGGYIMPPEGAKEQNIPTLKNFIPY